MEPGVHDRYGWIPVSFESNVFRAVQSFEVILEGQELRPRAERTVVEGLSRPSGRIDGHGRTAHAGWKRHPRRIGVHAGISRYWSDGLENADHADTCQARHPVSVNSQ